MEFLQIQIPTDRTSKTRTRATQMLTNKFVEISSTPLTTAPLRLRSCIKFPCGICNKTVQQIIKQYNVTLVIFGFTVDAMVSLILNMNTSKQILIPGSVWYVVLNIRWIMCHLLDVTTLNINNSNSMRFLESLPNVEIVNEA